MFQKHFTLKKFSETASSIILVDICLSLSINMQISPVVYGKQKGPQKFILLYTCMHGKEFASFRDVPRFRRVVVT